MLQLIIMLTIRYYEMFVLFVKAMFECEMEDQKGSKLFALATTQICDINMGKQTDGKVLTGHTGTLLMLVSHLCRRSCSCLTSPYDRRYLATVVSKIVIYIICVFLRQITNLPLLLMLLHGAIVIG